MNSFSPQPESFHFRPASIRTNASAGRSSLAGIRVRDNSEMETATFARDVSSAYSRDEAGSG